MASAKQEFSSEFQRQYKLASAKAEGGYFYFFVREDKFQTRNES